MNYTKRTTSAEVFFVIKAKHFDELVPFSSYSAPEGSSLGDPSTCIMATEYGFKHAPVPIIGVKTTWQKTENCSERKNERHEYWLCIPVEEE